MARERNSMPTRLHMQEDGKMVYTMVKVNLSGLTVLAILAHTSKESSKVKAAMLMFQAKCTRENGQTASKKDGVSSSVQRVRCSRGVFGAMVATYTRKKKSISNYDDLMINKNSLPSGRNLLISTINNNIHDSPSLQHFATTNTRTSTSPLLCL
jgi:hypothetical protein